MNTKTISLISFFIFVLTFFSCSQKKEIELEDYKGLITSLVNSCEQTIARNNNLVKDINAIRTKMILMTYDPQSRKTSLEMIPLFKKANLKTNQIDDLLLNTLNEIINKEEGINNWLKKNSVTQTTSYDSFYRLKKIDSPKWTTKMLGVDSEESINRAENLRVSLLNYRDELILAIADSVINYKNQLQIITIENLSSFEGFKSYLEKIDHLNKFELLEIYEELTFPKEIPFSDKNILWNQKVFQNQPLIGAISTLNYYRNKIRIAQLLGAKTFWSRIDKPLKPLYEYQE